MTNNEIQGPTATGGGSSPAGEGADCCVATPKGKRMPEQYRAYLEMRRRIIFDGPQPSAPAGHPATGAEGGEGATASYQQLAARFHVNMGSTAEEALDDIETRFIPLFEKLRTATSGMLPKDQLYRTALLRLWEYTKQSLDSLRVSFFFPAHSMFRSIVETIGVLCYTANNPHTIKNYVGYDETGVAYKFKSTPTAARLIKLCRRQTYRYPLIQIFRDVPEKNRHLFAYKNDKTKDGNLEQEGLWSMTNNLDHFTFQTIDPVFRRHDENGYFNIRAHDLVVDPVSLYAPTMNLWILLAEGINHLGIYANRLLERDFSRMVGDTPLPPAD